jgi:predicted RNA-binding Zn-ribbon protein involved in translation (DUF1610 family)
MELLIICKGQYDSTADSTTDPARESERECGTIMTKGDSFVDQDHRHVFTYQCPNCGNQLEVQVKF